MNLVVSTLQAGGGKRGYRVDAEGAAGGHIVPFQRVVRSGERDANGDLPPDVWAQRGVAATLSPFDLGSDSRAVELVVSATGSKAHALTAEGHDAVRRLTPRECERLQGFPDDWTLTSNGKPQADSPRYQQMGNAVAVPVFEWVARRIVASETAA